MNRRHWLAGAAFLAAWVATGCKAAPEGAVKLPEPAFDSPASAPSATQTAVFAGGCFWGVQAVFQHTQGVLNAVSGYSGGPREHANYEHVSAGLTTHAEAVQITYDPKQISYGRLLQILFSVAHDPTQLNRQGPDSGTQYRSAIFYLDARQKEVAERYIAQLDAAKAFPDKIVTQLTPLAAFYPAEPYHQDYATLHPNSPYIAQFDRPKLISLMTLMPEVYRDTPVLVSARN
jgi:peptide-methionine (S)-S-oxide reductase